MQAKRSVNTQDYVTNKILLAITAAALGVGGLMVLHRYIRQAQYFLTAYAVVRVLTLVGLAGMVAGGVWWYSQRKRKMDTTGRYWIGKHVFCLSTVLTCSMAFVWVLTALFFAYNTAIAFLYAAIPALAVLYLFYYSYPREFFLIALACCVSAGLTWLMGQLLNETNWGHSIVFAAAGVALAASGLLVVLRGRQNQGRLLGQEVFGHEAGYGKMIVTLVVMALSVVAAFLLGPVAAYYLLFFIFGCLFVWAVYYTVRML